MTDSAVSFFVTGGTLQETAGSYVTRRADDELFAGLKAGEFCYVLTSRQMGKSSLMIRTSRRLQSEGVTTVILDLTRLGQNLTAEQWYLGLLNLVGERIGIEDELEDYWFGEKNKGPWVKWSTALRDIVLKRITGPLVLLVDEIDVVRSLPFSTDEFFAGIREFYNRRTQDPELHRLSFALFGVATPSDLIRDTRLTPFNIGKRIELTDFTEHEALPLAKGLGPGMGEKLLKRALHWTGGHPYLTQRLCREVAQHLPVKATRDVDRLCSELFLSPQARVQDDNLLFVRERLLRSEVELAGLLDLYGKVRRGTPLPDEENNPLIEVLKLSGIVRAANGRLAGRNRIYEEVFDSAWVENNMPEAEVRRQQAALRKGRFQVATAALVVLLLMGILSLTAFFQRNRAVASERDLARQTRTMEETQASLLFQRGIKEAFEGNQNRAACWLNEAYRFRQERNLGDLPSLRFALHQTLKAFDNQVLTFSGHTAQVFWVAVSPDGKRIATASGDGTARVWDSQSGVELKRLVGYPSDVNSVAFSPDGRRLVTSGRDRTIRLWDADTGVEIRQFPGHTGLIYSVGFSPDGKRLVSGSWDQTARIWDVETGAELRKLSGHTRQVYIVSFSPDGKRVATSSGDRTCRIWDAETGAELKRLQGHTDLVASLAFSPDGRKIVTGCVDKTAKVWDIETGSLTGQLVGTGGFFDFIAFSPDGRFIATGGIDKSLHLWNSQTGVEIQKFEGHTAPIRAVAFFPNGKMIATASSDKTVRLWNITSIDNFRHFDVPDDQINAMALSPDGKRLVYGGFEPSARVWDIENGKELMRLQGKGELVTACEFSPDGRWIVTASNRGAQLWDAQTGRELKQFRIEEKSGAIFGTAFSRDSRMLALGGRDKIVRLWNVETGALIRELKGHTNRICSVSFSPDGRTLASTGGDKTIRLWNVETGVETKLIEGHTDDVYVLAFSPDGQRIATGGADLTVRLWNPWTGAEIHRFEGFSELVLSLAFSPDGKLIASTGQDNRCSILDTETGLEICRLAGHEKTVKSVFFSADGKWLATTGFDGNFRLWDIDFETRKPEEVGAILDRKGAFRFSDGRVILK